MSDARPDPQTVAIVAVTKKGSDLGRRLKGRLPGSHLYVPEKFALSDQQNEYPFQLPASDTIRRVFTRYRSLVLVMATGIAVRMISTELRDKRTDPAVVAVDDAGTFAVSLLSGHLGGANALSRKIASLLGAVPVVTTASEANHTLAVDLLGKERGWVMEDEAPAKAVAAALVNGGPVAVYQDTGDTGWRRETGPLPDNVHVYGSLEDVLDASDAAAIVITDRILGKETESLPAHTVVFRPRSLVVGIGCNRGTPCSEMEAAVQQLFSRHALSLKSIRNLATIDIKKDEAGLLNLAHKYGLPVDYHSKEDLKRVADRSGASAGVMRYVGTPSVCEAAAVLSSHAPLIVPKTSFHRAVTLAVSRVLFDDKPEVSGKLFLVGLGPGDPQHLTFRARQALEECDVVVGYDTYVKLIEALLPHKEVIATGMRQEVQRARTALDLVKAGRKVAVVCSGDSGIYGMAGLIGEMVREQGGDLSNIEVIPGVPSLVASAALLGAPLTGDFAVVSLSNYLVSWEEITRRLEMAARSGFVIVLHNPKSRHRQHQVAEAREVLLRHLAPNTPVGIVSDANRPGQQTVITDLEHMLEHDIGMTTTVIVGNSKTFTFQDWMVTPRGYTLKET